MQKHCQSKLVWWKGIHKWRLFVKRLTRRCFYGYRKHAHMDSLSGHNKKLKFPISFKSFFAFRKRRVEATEKMMNELAFVCVKISQRILFSRGMHWEAENNRGGRRCSATRRSEDAPSKKKTLQKKSSEWRTIIIKSFHGAEEKNSNLISKVDSVYGCMQIRKLKGGVVLNGLSLLIRKLPSRELTLHTCGSCVAKSNKMLSYYHCVHRNTHSHSQTLLFFTLVSSEQLLSLFIKYGIYSCQF